MTEVSEGWILIALPAGSPEPAIQSLAGRQPSGATLALTRARGLWIRAVLKLRLLRRVRVLWSQAGSWLNLYRPGNADPGRRAVIARWWTGAGRALIQGFNTKELFEPLNRGSRASRAREVERLRAISAGLRQD